MAKVSKKKNFFLLFILIAIVLLSFYLANKKMSFDTGSDAFDPMKGGTLRCNPRLRMIQCPDGHFCRSISSSRGVCTPVGGDQGQTPRPTPDMRHTGETCGGIIGRGCAEGMVCIYSDGSSRAPYPDASGRCAYTATRSSLPSPRTPEVPPPGYNY